MDEPGSMRILIAAIVCLTLTNVAMAQPMIPTLEPCDDDGALESYEAGVAEQIRRTLNASFDLTVTVFPAFTPEWAVSLVEGRDGPEIVLSEFVESYWHSGWVDIDGNRRRWDPDAAHAPVATKHQKIPAAIAERLRSVWDIALSGVRAYEKTWAGLDGVTYKFRDGDGRCGSTWSPPEDTLPGRLVAIVEELRVLAISRVEPDTSERRLEMLGRLTAFLREFGDQGGR